MASFSIIVGSMLGASEYVADELSALLTEFGHNSEIFLKPDLPAIPLDSIWLICTSTHGAGELPDNIQPFYQQLKSAELGSDLRYTVVGLGDTSYDTFCEGAKHFTRLLADKNAVAEPVFIDVLERSIPEEAAVDWARAWLPAFNAE